MLSAAALACVAGKAVAQQQSEKPNILYIMCDDHAMQTISAYGSELSKLAPTPNIDRLAKRGMLFTNAFVENSLSTPSRACLMTGLYSHQNGQRQLAEGIDSTKTFFSELLQQAGYETSVVGKWHMGCEPKGFDNYHILNDQGQYYNPTFCHEGEYKNFKQEMGYCTTLITDHAIDMLEHRDKSKPFCMLVHHKAPHRNWMPDIKNIGRFDQTVFPLPETLFDDYSTRGSAAHTQRMSIDKDMRMGQDLKVPELVDPNDAESWDAYLGLMNELGRLTKEQRVAWDKYYMPRNRQFLDQHLTGRDLVIWKYQNYIRDYVSVICSVDESVGRLLDYLEQNGLDKNTIVVYTSDQGFYMGEHGWFDKRFMYEESFHTPLIISYPGHVAEGTQCDQLVQNIDYAPTFLSLAGIEKPKELPGRSLEPLFSGKPVKNWRTSLYYHYYDYPTYHMVRKHDGVRTDRYKLIHFYGKGMDRAVSENKYQQMPGTSEYRCHQYLKNTGYYDANKNDADVDYYEFYDLQADPTEVNNVIDNAKYAKEIKKMKKLLTNYRTTLAVDE